MHLHVAARHLHDPQVFAVQLAIARTCRPHRAGIDACTPWPMNRPARSSARTRSFRSRSAHGRAPSTTGTGQWLHPGNSLSSKAMPARAAIAHAPVKMAMIARSRSIRPFQPRRPFRPSPYDVRSSLRCSVAAQLRLLDFARGVRQLRVHFGARPSHHHPAERRSTCATRRPRSQPACARHPRTARPAGRADLCAVRPGRVRRWRAATGRGCPAPRARPAQRMHQPQRFTDCPPRLTRSPQNHSRSRRVETGSRLQQALVTDRGNPCRSPMAHVATVLSSVQRHGTDR